MSTSAECIEWSRMSWLVLFLLHACSYYNPLQAVALHGCCCFEPHACSPTPTIPNLLPSCTAMHPFLQAPALRALCPAEREVLLLLGSDIAASQGQLLIQENDKVRVGTYTRSKMYCSKMCHLGDVMLLCAQSPFHTDSLCNSARS
jgi:hypothetical protein